jgi:hypothetical protein
MDCAEREHLIQVCRTASHELAWAIQEECRLMIARSAAVPEFAAVVEKGMQHRRDVLEAYLRHVGEHACLAR